MTLYRSSNKVGAHRRITRTERIIDWFRVILFESGYDR